MSRQPNLAPCVCASCATPEERAAIVREQEEDRLVKRAAFERYWQDRQAGRPLRLPSYYIDAVRQGAVNPAAAEA